MTHRTALYARYSSDQQNPRSIADQLALCERHAAARGWTVTARFEDAAISGSAMANRPGLLALLAAAEAGVFDRVLVEHEDRLSRSLEHLAHIANRLSYARVILSTQATDAVETMHVAFNGAMAQQYLVNLSQKTRRGMAASAEQGKATGSRLYGYRSAPGGAMIIVEDEANLVRRIFDLYAAGLTGRDIAARLNIEGQPGPRGGHWRGGQITGSAARANGILHTQLYAGVKVWNRLDVRKDPRTGARLPTVRPMAEWKRTPVPHLRIVSPAQWDAVQARFAGAAQAEPGRRRQRHMSLLSGLLRCGVCGASYTAIGDGRLMCTARREKGPAVCCNPRTISRAAIEGRVLDGLRTRLLAPDAVRAYVRAYHQEWQAQADAHRADIAPLQNRLAALDRRIGRVIDAVCEGQASPAMRERLTRMEQEKADLQAALAAAQARAGDAAPITLHPRLPDLYAARVARLQARLAADAEDIELIQSVRDLIDQIVITPQGEQKGGPIDVTLHGRLAMLLDQPAPATPSLAQAPFGVRMVAGARYNQPPTVAAPIVRIAC